MGGSGENLGAISICRLLCLVLSFSPSPPLSLFLLLVCIYLCLVHARVLLVLVSLVSLFLSIGIVIAPSLSPIRYRKLASGTRCREVPCRNGETRGIEGFVAFRGESRIESLRRNEDCAPPPPPRMGNSNPLDFSCVRNVNFFFRETDHLFPFKVYWKR